MIFSVNIEREKETSLPVSPKNPINMFEIEHKLTFTEPVVKSEVSPNVLKITIWS